MFSIGYHFVIRRDGTREEGRRLPNTGAHVRGFNERSIGICLVGGVGKGGEPQNNFTRDQLDELIDLLDDLNRRYPTAEILGHRDLISIQNARRRRNGKPPVRQKACPSFDVRTFIAEEAPWLAPPADQ